MRIKISVLLFTGTVAACADKNLSRRCLLIKLRSESSEAVLVLIGFPRSGKSETGTTLLGTSDLKTKQEIHHDFCDFPVIARDTQGFENVFEFGKIYNSLKCYEKKKVVFGLTIRVGRFEPGLTETLKDIFQEKGIGKHLQRKTFLVFTNVDELENDEDCYQDGFIEWLRNTKDLVLLIASLDLDYCVVQNRQSGDKRVQQANKLVQEMKRKLQKDNQEETWYHFVNNKSVEDMLCSTCFKDDENYKDIEFVKRLHQNVKMTYCHFVSMVDRLHRKKDEEDQIDMIFEAFAENEAYMTHSDVEKVKKIIRRKNVNCNIL